MRNGKRRWVISVAGFAALKKPAVAGFSRMGSGF